MIRFVLWKNCKAIDSVFYITGSEYEVQKFLFFAEEVRLGQKNQPIETLFLAAIHFIGWHYRAAGMKNWHITFKVLNKILPLRPFGVIPKGFIELRTTYWWYRQELKSCLWDVYSEAVNCCVRSFFVEELYVFCWGIISKFYKLGWDDFEGHFILRVSIQKHPKLNLWVVNRES